MKLYNELAEYYFSIEEVTRDLPDEISFIKSLIPRNRIVNILDLGCGTGEHLGILAKAGYKCTGIDSSKEMLRVARVRNSTNVKYFIKSMDEIDYYEEFDLIISLFGSFNYLTENEKIDKTLWNIWRALKQNGTALLEIWNAEPLLKIEEKPLDRVSTTLYKGTKIERHRGFSLKEKDKKTLVEVFYKYAVSGQTVETLEDRHLMRAFKKNEIEKFFKDNGFKIKNCYSSIYRDSFHINSNKMIYLLEKS